MYESSYRTRPTRRQWLAAGSALAAVLVLLVLIGVACNARSGAPVGDDPPGAPATGSPPADGGSPGGSGVGGSQAGSGGQEGGGQDGGDGGDGQDGAGDGDGGGSGAGSTAVEPSPERCLSYDPSDLSVKAYQDAWRMWSGNEPMKVFDTKADADDAVLVARNWRRMCVIGPEIVLAGESAHIVYYWKEPSGLPLGLAPTLDCLTYDPAELTIAGPAPDGWRLFAGETMLVVLESEADALRAELVAGEHTQLCFIGRGNTRENPERYILHHWR